MGVSPNAFERRHREANRLGLQGQEVALRKAGFFIDG